MAFEITSFANIFFGVILKHYIYFSKIRIWDMRRTALFVGVNNYRDKKINNLSCAVNDAAVTCQEFKNKGFETTLLTDNEVSAIGVREKVKEICEGLKSGDIFVFYFSGHGHEAADNHYLLCPGTLNDTLDIDGGGDALSLAVVRRVSEKCNEAGIRRLFILDCCRNNIRAGAKGDFAAPAGKGLELVGKDEGDGILPPWILRSCQPGQRSYEDVSKGHGYFTLALEKTLKDQSVKSFPAFFRELCSNMAVFIRASEQRLTLGEYTGGTFPLFDGWQDAPEPVPAPASAPAPAPASNGILSPEERSRFYALREQINKIYTLEVAGREFPGNMRPRADQVCRIIAKLKNAEPAPEALRNLEELQQMVEEFRLFNETRERCLQFSQKAALEMKLLKDAGIELPETCAGVENAARKALNEKDCEAALALFEKLCGVLDSEKEKLSPDFLEQLKEVNAAKAQGLVFSEDNKVITQCRKKDISSCVIPSAVTTIGATAFRGCSRLQELVIPDGVISIGESAFEGCSALSEITIPRSVSKIGKWAFAGCRNLKKVQFAGKGTDLTSPEGKTIFEGCVELQIRTVESRREKPGLLDWLVFLCHRSGVEKCVRLPEGGAADRKSAKVMTVVIWLLLAGLVCYGAGYLLARFL